MKPTATLMRFSYQEKQTLGYLTFDQFPDVRILVLELPWKNNRRGESCIPEGVYNVIPWTSPSKGKCMKIVSPGQKEVNGRSDVLQHKGNYYTQIRGCQLPGMGLSDMNNDGLHDVISSGIALQKIMDIAPDGYQLLITSPYEFQYNG